MNTPKSQAPMPRNM